MSFVPYSARELPPCSSSTMRCHFLKCIKTLVETIKEEDFQIIMEKFYLFKSEINVA